MTEYIVNTLVFLFFSASDILRSKILFAGNYGTEIGDALIESSLAPSGSLLFNNFIANILVILFNLNSLWRKSDQSSK